MTRRSTKLLALVMAVALLLSGCSGRVADEIHGLLGSIPATPYSEMEYTRPDLDALQAQYDETIRLAEGGAGEEALNESLNASWDAYYHVCTLQNLAMLHADADLTDEYWNAEYDLCWQSGIAVEQGLDEVLTACAATGLADFNLLAGYDAGASCNYSDAVVALLEQENALISDYYDAIYGVETVIIDGEKVDYFSYIDRPGLSDEAYQAAALAYDEACFAVSAPIYAELIRIRQALATEYGYDSYEQFQFDSYGRAYTAEQAQAYLQGIAEIISPWVAEIMAQRPYDEITYGPMSERELVETLREAAEGLAGWSREAVGHMYDNGLYDAAYSPNKSSQSYTVYLLEYEEPFCFISTYGDEEDLLTFAHEFGHYVDSYANYNATTNLDLMETYSMAMENLILSRLQKTMDKDAYHNLLLIQMMSLLDVYSSQAFYAAFESAAYQLPESELTPEGLRSLAAGLAEQYGTPDLEAYWAQVDHLFEYPFYIFSYCVGQDVALQLWQMELDEAGTGSACFDELVYWDEDALMPELERVGLASPFDANRLPQILQQLQTQLQTAMADN